MKYLLVIILIALTGLGALRVASEPQATHKVQQPTKKPTKIHNTLKQPVTEEMQTYFDLTNEERARAGDPPLSLNNDLNISAQAKCNDMEAKTYYSHNTPYGKTWQDFFTIKAFAIGENLLQENTYYTPQVGMTAWMNSPEHKDNILKEDYNQVGFAACEGSEGHLVVEHFATVYN